MSGSTPRRLWKYVTQCLRLGAYFQRPGDGRLRPRIAARAMAWALVLGHLLREDTFRGGGGPGAVAGPAGVGGGAGVWE